MLPVETRRRWANKVLGHYSTALTRFRRFRAPRPELMDSIAACRQGLNFSVFAQLLQQPGSPGSESPATDRATGRKRKAAAKGDTSSKPASQGERAKEKINALPNRPDYPDQKFKELSAALREAHPDICAHYCLSRNGCTREKCKFKHEAPPSFKEFVASHVSARK